MILKNAQVGKLKNCLNFIPPGQFLLSAQKCVEFVTFKDFLLNNPYKPTVNTIGIVSKLFCFAETKDRFPIPTRFPNPWPVLSSKVLNNDQMK